MLIVHATERLIRIDEASQPHRIIHLHPWCHGQRVPHCLTPQARLDPLQINVFPEASTTLDYIADCRCCIYPRKRALIARLQLKSAAINSHSIADSMLTGHTASIATRDLLVRSYISRAFRSYRLGQTRRDTTNMNHLPDVSPRAAFRYGTSASLANINNVAITRFRFLRYLECGEKNKL